MSDDNTPDRNGLLSEIRRELSRSLVVLRQKGPSQVQFWFLALVVGILAGFTALGFRIGIEWLQALLYQVDDTNSLHRAVGGLAWYWFIIFPAVGGLVVGIVLDIFTPDGRVRSVADVIEGAALNGGRVETRAGLASAVASFLTLAMGGSSGREGPVVHLAGVISTGFARLIKADGITGRDLLGCAVAAAVSVSFNAPIAGALFALEVVLRHFAVRAFAPIAIASVAGAIIGRIFRGDVPEFTLVQENELSFYIELPAFMILGLLCGVIAYVLIKSIFWVDTTATRLQSKLRMHRALCPAVAGAVLGVIAIWFPHIIGVGYGITFDALTAQIGFKDALIFALVKVAAVAITIGGRMGGGVFSPSLVLGALSGLAFGIVATHLVPSYSGGVSLYALAGMGAVAAAVLGAPISTSMIVFELTGDWQTGLAVLVTVSLSAALASRLVDRSFFLTQLERRGVRLAAGPQAYLLATFRVTSLMRRADAPDGAILEDCEALIQQGIYVDTTATLDRVMPMFEQQGLRFVPVVTRENKNAPFVVRGALFHVDALRAFNRALAAVSAEEHS